MPVPDSVVSSSSSIVMNRATTHSAMTVSAAFPAAATNVRVEVEDMSIEDMGVEQQKENKGEEPSTVGVPASSRQVLEAAAIRSPQGGDIRLDDARHPHDATDRSPDMHSSPAQKLAAYVDAA